MTPDQFYDTESIWQTSLMSLLAIASMVPFFWLGSYWFRLARHFPDRKKPAGGNWFRYRAGFMGQHWLSELGGAMSNSHSGWINVCIADEGVFFEVIFFLRLGHPPFFVPWEKISKVNRWENFGRDWIQFVIDIGDYRERAVAVCLGRPKRSGKGTPLILKKGYSKAV